MLQPILSPRRFHLTRPTAARLASGLTLLAALAAVPAAGQPPADPPAERPAPALVYYTLMYLGDPALPKELKMTDEQVKAVAALTPELAAAIRSATVGSKEREEATRAAEKALGDALGPDRLRRAKQITLQQLNDSTFPSALLHRVPEVADALKLTADQKAKLTAGSSPFNTTRLTAVLDDAQKAKWAELTGEKFAGTLRRSPTSSAGGFAPRGAATVPPRLRYVAQKAVQDDLGLDQPTRAKVSEMYQKWLRSLALGTRAEEDRKRYDEAVRAADTEVAALLPPDKLARLRQIELQLSLRGADVYQSPAVAEGLKLTDAQRAELRDMAAGRKELAALFLTGEDSEAIAKKVAAHKAAVRARLDRVLTADQRGRLKDLLGAPFTGDVSSGLGGIGGGFSPAPVSTAPVYVSITGMIFAPAKAVHDELKLTPEQAAKLTALGEKTLAESRAISSGFGANPPPEQAKRRAALAAASQKELTAILTPAQWARFKQIVLQQMDDAPRGGGLVPGTAGRVGEVAAALKLSAEQKQRLLNREAIRAVLTPEQQANWKEMLGEPFAGNLFPTRVGKGPRFVPLLPAAVACLQQPSVRDELKLTDEQVKGVAAIQESWAGYFTETPGDPEARQKQLAAARAAADKAVAALLGPKAAARLRQIELQQVERLSTRMFLTDPRVETALDLTADQKGRIEALTRDAEKTRSLLRSELVVSGTGLQDEYGRTVVEFNRQFDARVAGVLTDAQKARLKELLGEPFKGELPPPMRPGIGGFGGPPG